MLFGRNVPLLLIRMKVMIAISSRGTFRPNSISENTSLGFGHGTVVDMRTAMYEIRKVPKMNVSLSRKIHIIGLPHGTHVTIGVIFLLIVATKVRRGDLERQRPGFLTGRRGNYEIVEILGLYWHFVDLVWVFIFAFFYLW